MTLKQMREEERRLMREWASELDHMAAYAKQHFAAVSWMDRNVFQYDDPNSTGMLVTAVMFEGQIDGLEVLLYSYYTSDHKPVVLAEDGTHFRQARYQKSLVPMYCLLLDCIEVFSKLCLECAGAAANNCLFTNEVGGMVPCRLKEFRKNARY